MSILNNNKDLNIHVYIVSDEKSEKFYKHMNDFELEEAGFSINHLNFEKKNFPEFNTPKHFSDATYYRLFLDDILPSEVKKALYIDCDTIIRRDISTIRDVDLDGNIIAGVPHVKREGYKYDLPITADYINTGVLLIDIDAWREEEIGKECLTYIKENQTGFRLPIQNTINTVLQNNIQLIDPEYNYTYDWSKQLLSGGGQIDPRIVHFTTHRKPWKYHHSPEYGDEYIRYLDRSPFKAEYNDKKNYKYPVKKFRESSASDITYRMCDLIQTIIY